VEPLVSITMQIAALSPEFLISSVLENTVCIRRYLYFEGCKIIEKSEIINEPSPSPSMGRWGEIIVNDQ